MANGLGLGLRLGLGLDAPLQCLLRSSAWPMQEHQVDLSKDGNVFGLQCLDAICSVNR
jgi:hypothetical protein